MQQVFMILSISVSGLQMWSHTHALHLSFLCHPFTVILLSEAINSLTSDKYLTT